MISAVTISIAVLLGLFAIPLLLGKGASLIAGHNALSASERAKVNEKKLCRAMGLLLVFIIGCMLLGDVFFARGLNILGGLAWMTWIVLLIAFVAWANTARGKRFFAKEQSEWE